MTLTFIIHQSKAFWRSKNTGKSIAMRIVMGILVLYLLLNVLVVAFFIDRILEKTYPNQEIIPSFNSLLMYYFLIDLLIGRKRTLHLYFFEVVSKKLQLTLYSPHKH